MKKGIFFAIIIIFLFIFLLMITNISQASPKFTIIYIVQEGDTLSNIAQDYGVSVYSILAANNISTNKWIKVGEELIIPRSKMEKKPNWDLTLFNQDKDLETDLKLKVGSNYSIRVNPKQPLPKVNIPKDKIIQYHVGVGDTLFDLARSFNTSIGVIMALNEMEDSMIRVGQTIFLPINKLTPRQVLAKIIKPDDLNLLARAIHGEARGESFIGQVAVGAVIINRVLSSYFPNTFYDVIHQPGQFSAVIDGQFYLKPNRTAYRAAREAIKGTDPTLGSMYYYNPKMAKNQWWFAKRRLMVTIGNHVFTK